MVISNTLQRWYSTWWLIPPSKWVITPVINGISRVNPLITGVITHLLSGMSHQVGTYPIFSGTYMHWYNLLSLLWPRCTRLACEQKVRWKLSSRRSPNSWILWQHEMAEGPTTPRRPNVMQTFCLSALMCFQGPNLITTSLNGFNGGFYSLVVRLDINQLWIHNFQ